MKKTGKIALVVVISLLTLSGCNSTISENREKELLENIDLLETQISNLKTELSNSYKIMNKYVYSEEGIETKSLEILDIINPYENKDIINVTNSRILIMASYGFGQPFYYEMIIEDNYDSTLLTDVLNDLKIGDHYEVKFIKIKDFSPTRDVAKVLNIIPIN